jgi:hypothetical protein
MVVGVLLYSYENPVHNCFDDEAISLLDLGRPRNAMIPRASEAEALDEGSAQKGFGVSSLGGGPFPRGLAATGEPIEIPRSL